MRAPTNKHVPATIDRYLSAREVADLLGVSLDSVRTWTRRGDLPAINLSPRGGQRHTVRYSETAIAAWLADQPKAGA